MTNGDIYFKLGIMEEASRNAESGRKRIHEALERQDNILDETVTTLRSVSVSLQLTNELAVKTSNKLEEMIPLINDGNTFRIDATPIVKAMKTVRNALYAIAGLLGVMGISIAVAAVYAKEIIKYAILWVIHWVGVGI